MGNKAASDLQIKQLGEEKTADDSSTADSVSPSEVSSGTPDSAVGKEKRKGSRLLGLWRGTANSPRGKKEKVKNKGHLKIVILGIAACGKSTFVRQIRNTHNSLYTQAELQNYYHIICTNIWDGMKELCIHMKKHDITPEVPENAKRLRYFRELSADLPPMNEREIERIKTLWTDPAVSNCIEVMKSQDVVIHNFAYFMDRLDDIAQQDYVPTSRDILFARQRSTGASEVTILHNNVHYTLVDMGGQKPERAKWDRALELGVNGIFFFCSVEEFDIDSAEEKGKTKLEISFQIWKELFDNERVIKQLEVFLIFNKVDLLEEKVKKNFDSFQEAYPDYNGQKTTDGVLQYLEDKFCDAIPEFFDKELTCLRCCALDPELVTGVFRLADKFMAKLILK